MSAFQLDISWHSSWVVMMIKNSFYACCYASCFIVPLMIIIVIFIISISWQNKLLYHDYHFSYTYIEHANFHKVFKFIFSRPHNFLLVAACQNKKKFFTLHVCISRGRKLLQKFIMSWHLSLLCMSVTVCSFDCLLQKLPYITPSTFRDRLINVLEMPMSKTINKLWKFVAFSWLAWQQPALEFSEPLCVLTKKQERVSWMCNDTKSVTRSN